MGRFNSRYTTITFEDSSGVTITAGPGPGDFQFSETNKENTEKVRVMDRGAFDCHVEGDDLEQSWSLSLGLQSESLTSAAASRITDWLEQAGIYDPDTGSSATTTVSSNPNVWAFKVKVTMTLGSASATWTLPHNLASYTFAEAKEGHTLSVSGTNNGKITRT